MARKVKQSEFVESISFPDATSTRESLPAIPSSLQCSSKDEAPITLSTNVSESSALSQNENPLELNEQTSRRILLVGDRILPRQVDFLFLCFDEFTMLVSVFYFHVFFVFSCGEKIYTCPLWGPCAESLSSNIVKFAVLY